MSQQNDWQKFTDNLLRYSEPDLWLDLSLMDLPKDLIEAKEKCINKSLDEIRKIEEGAKVNTDEDKDSGGRQVGHYWLRNPELAPDEIGISIQRKIAEVKAFSSGIHKGEILNPSGEKFTDLLLIGIGGSALGPQLAIDALTDHTAPMKIHYFDNTDPDGMDRILNEIGERISKTLTLVISKSGGTKETRNGMLEAKATYENSGLEFGKHAIAVTGEKSQLDQYATQEDWIGIFPMEDWVGGRTSITSVVGLLPMALMGININEFLEGASAIDRKTRPPEIKLNAALLMALSWHHVGEGKGSKAMVILPYKDRLNLLSKYLQQLVMESLGKEFDRDDNQVHQGITVYGNKGSTDQHAYVQQLRDGINNFFVTFIEVRESRMGNSIEVDPGFKTGDYLQGFLRGTRSALAEASRKSMTISIPILDAFHLGGLIALYERAVSYYASLININAYHQPGVEAGKKAATDFLEVLSKTESYLSDRSGEKFTAGDVANNIQENEEATFHALHHLSSNRDDISAEIGESPEADHFVRGKS
ncbi:MAG: glucose-6-phosphate isomerase [Verrucomicrobiales bacterium]